MPSKIKQRAIRIEDDLWERAKAQAVYEDRSVNGVINRALKEYLHNHKAEGRDWHMKIERGIYGDRGN